jgi:hypothetical protein
MIRANCRERFTAEDFEFLRIWGERLEPKTAADFELVRESLWRLAESLRSLDGQVGPEALDVLLVSAEVNVKVIEHFDKNPTELKTLDRRCFEQLIAELWNGFGYEVELTPKTRDGGKDVIAVRKGHVSERYLIECKRPDPGHAVGVGPVRELYGVKVSEGATKAVLATTTHFSEDARRFFELNKWELEGKDYEGLKTWLKLYLGRSTRGTTP